MLGEHAFLKQQFTNGVNPSSHRAELVLGMFVTVGIGGLIDRHGSSSIDGIQPVLVNVDA